MSTLSIDPLTSSDKDWVTQFMIKQWGSNRVVSRGIVYYPHQLPGFIARNEGEQVGLITYSIQEDDKRK